jgi:hypothetical protein
MTNKLGTEVLLPAAGLSCIGREADGVIAIRPGRFVILGIFFF